MIQPNQSLPKPLTGPLFGISSGSRTTALDAELMETIILFLLGLGEEKKRPMFAAKGEQHIIEMKKKRGYVDYSELVV